MPHEDCSRNLLQDKNNNMIWLDSWYISLPGLVPHSFIYLSWHKHRSHKHSVSREAIADVTARNLLKPSREKQTNHIYPQSGATNDGNKHCQLLALGLII